MKEYPALVRLIAHGKVTIPIQIRAALGIGDGDLIEIRVARIEKGEHDKVPCST
jgi:bifunctional DNA-binding transcriptional regulator/antitoxin component of YhaV-PrlF toxin-antitoxin module